MIYPIWNSQEQGFCETLYDTEYISIATSAIVWIVGIIGMNLDLNTDLTQFVYSMLSVAGASGCMFHITHWYLPYQINTASLIFLTWTTMYFSIKMLTDTAFNKYTEEYAKVNNVITIITKYISVIYVMLFIVAQITNLRVDPGVNTLDLAITIPIAITILFLILFFIQNRKKPQSSITSCSIDATLGIVVAGAIWILYEPGCRDALAERFQGHTAVPGFWLQRYSHGIFYLFLAFAVHVIIQLYIFSDSLYHMVWWRSGTRLSRIRHFFFPILDIHDEEPTPVLQDVRVDAPIPIPM
jgi:hypothetical protein